MLLAKCLLHCFKNICGCVVYPAVGLSLVGAVQDAVGFIFVDTRFFIFDLFKSLAFLRDGQAMLPVYLISDIL